MIDLDAIEARAAAATYGPWQHNQQWIWPRDAYAPGDPDAPDTRIPQTDADATFIAHARQDVPDLAAEVRRLSARLAEAEGLLRGALGAVARCESGGVCQSDHEDIAAFLRGGEDGK